MKTWSTALVVVLAFVSCRQKSPVEQLFERAYAGDAIAQYTVAEAYSWGPAVESKALPGIPHNEGKAIEFYTLAANQNLGCAQQALADLYH